VFALMAELKAEGVTIVYISHKLDETRHDRRVIVMRRRPFRPHQRRDADAHADGEPDGRARAVGTCLAGPAAGPRARRC
jgi:energy-coupling factor transporter ATP-binding protein EcfA2